MKALCLSFILFLSFCVTTTLPAQALNSKTLEKLCQNYVDNNFTGDGVYEFACLSYFLGVIDASNQTCEVLTIEERSSSDEYTKLKLKLSKNSIGSVASSEDVDKVITNFFAWLEQNPTLANLPTTVGMKEWLTKKWPCD